MALFREGPSPHRTALAMIGARAGDHVLVIGALNGALTAQLALVTGLNGRTVVVDATSGAKSRVEAAAAKAGALVEFEPAPAMMLPLDQDQFDIVVLQRQLAPQETDQLPILAEATRLLRPRGRLIVIEQTKRPGLFGLLQAQTTGTLTGQQVCDVISRSSLRAARVVGDLDGVVYVEARKPGT